MADGSRMNWDAVLCKLRALMQLPAERTQPWDCVRPSDKLVCEFVTGIKCCELAIGRLPNTVDVTVEGALRAGYWGTTGEGVVEMSPKVEDPGPGRCVVAWLPVHPAVDVWRVCADLSGVIDGYVFRRMEGRLGAQTDRSPWADWESNRDPARSHAGGADDGEP